MYMVKSFFVRNVLVFLAVVSSMSVTSCVEDDYVETFGVSISGYVLQRKNTEGNVFTPCLFISSNSATFQLTDAEVYGSNTNVFEFERNNDYVFRTTGNDLYNSLTQLNGSYTFSGKAKAGETASSSFKFDFVEGDTLGDLEVLSLERKGSYFQATIKKGTNAKYVGFIVTPYETGEIPTRWSNYYKIVAENPIYSTEDKLDIQMAFTPYDLATSKARVQVFVSNEKAVYVESDMSRIYDKASDKFE